MPNTFLAEAYDLGDPWTTPQCGVDGIYGGAPYKGQHCCVDKSDSQPNGANCSGDHRGVWGALNDTRDWANLGPLHPRVKRPLGKRLAQSLHGSVYNGSMIAAGPAFAGCSLDQVGRGGGGGGSGAIEGAGAGGGGRTMTLRFDKALLKGESVGFDSSNTVAKEDTALYVLVNASVDTSDPRFVAAVEANHHEPFINIYPGNPALYTGPYSDGNEMGVLGWVAVAATQGATPDTLTVDLSGLKATDTVSAIRYGVGGVGYGKFSGAATRSGNANAFTSTVGTTRLCCGPFVDTALQPCGPERCPIKASGPNALPAAPFFAAVNGKTGKCTCFAPQVCN
jgi:hypothetical protein